MRTCRLIVVAMLAAAGLAVSVTSSVVPVARAAPAVPGSGAAANSPEAIAKATGKRVLLPELTTANSQTYVNPTGSRTLEESVVPVRRRTASGWAPVSGTAQSGPSSMAPQVATAPGEAGWTEVYKNFPTTNYWDGVHDDASQAKVGFAYDQTVTVRSYFQFGLGGLAGKHIQNAEVNFQEIYAPSCSPREVDIWETGPIGGGTTWNAQPGWTRVLGSANVAYGHESSGSCGPNPVGSDATQAVLDGANSSGVATFLLKAANEGDNYAWKKFSPSATLIVNYDSPPNAPGNLSAGFPNQGGQFACVDHDHAPYVATATPSLHATITDVDNGPLVAADFEWWIGRSSTEIGSATSPFGGSGGSFSVTVPAGAFGEGADIAWRVRGVNSSGTTGPYSPWCELFVDTTAPGTAPVVSSTVYTEAKPGDPNAKASGGVGETEPFTFTANGVPDVAGFRYCEAAGQCTPATNVAANQLGGSATVGITPMTAGPNDLWVRSVDRAGNLGPIYHTDASSAKPQEGYHFLVAPGSPAVGLWHLDNFGTVDSVPDSSGNHHDGTVAVPAQAFWGAGRVGEALHQLGTPTSAVSTTGPVLHTNQSFTVSAWVDLAHDDASSHTAVSQDGSQASGFFLQYRGDLHKWVFEMTRSDVAGPVIDQAIATTPVQAGVWTHLVGEYDAGAGQLKIFVNGALAGTASHPASWDAGGTFEIGRDKWAGATADYWRGAIDEVQVFQRVLPATAAADSGEANVHDLATGNAVQEAFLPLTEGSGTTAQDRSGNYDNGTLSGGTAWTTGHAGPHAVHFDESTGQISTPAPAVRTDNSFTISADVKLDAVDGKFQTLVSEDGQHASVFALQYCPTSSAAGRWCFSVAPADVPNPAWQTVYAAAQPEAGVWTQLTGVYDAAAQKVRIYVDGQPDATQAVTSPPVNTTGPLVLGRGRQNDTNLAYLGGSLDDMHVYAGVLSDQAISEEFAQESAHHVPGPTDAYPGALTSWYQAGTGHFVTTGPAPAGYYVEGQLGLMAPAGAPGTHALYSCHYSGGQFVSPDASCEGDQVLATIGAVYDAPPADGSAVEIYRCDVQGGDHFVSTVANCGGQPGVTPEMPLGYLRAYVHLNRYVKTDAPPDHAMATSTLLVSPGAAFVYSLAGYSNEEPLGLLGQAGGDIPVYTCVKGGDEFLATTSDCGGGAGVQPIAWIGNLWSTPPPATATAQLFDCEMAGSNERFDSTDSSCDGQTVLGPLGYLITQP